MFMHSHNNKENDQTRAVMAMYINILDQYFRFLSLILPESGRELRADLPGIDAENKSLTTMDHISTVESIIGAEFIDTRLRAAFLLENCIQEFLKFISDRPEKQERVMIITL
jgi:hypothetical protein